jgi:hypothetical protein
MHGTYKPTLKSPSGNYEIIYGITHEYGMGGPYASEVYLKPKDKAPFFISSMCYGDVFFTDDESCIYFLHLNLERKLQVRQFDIETDVLKTFVDIFDHAAFESTKSKFTYTVNRKNWIATDNKYTEGLIICDTNDENIVSKITVKPVIHLIPNQGFEFVTFNDSRKSVEERISDGERFPNSKIDYYTKYGFHIHYNDKDIVEFIEIMGDMESTFELYGKNPFTTDVAEMIRILKTMNNGQENLIQAPTSYMYLELGLGIFRVSTPENFEKYIQECKAENPDDFINGTPEWLLIDYEKTKYFQTIGLGNQQYFRNPIYYINE